MDGEDGTTKGAKREGKLLFKDESYKIVRLWCVSWLTLRFIDVVAMLLLGAVVAADAAEIYTECFSNDLAGWTNRGSLRIVFSNGAASGS